MKRNDYAAFREYVTAVSAARPQRIFSLASREPFL